MRTAVLFAMIAAGASVRLQMDKAKSFEEEDPAKISAAVDEEFAFAQTTGDAFSMNGNQLKAKEQENGEGSTDSSLLTLTKAEDGTINCEGCSGDSSDMVAPFWRYSLKSQNKGGMSVNSFTVPAKTHFWNAKETTQCLKDKYVLMLGDSTTVENLDDIILLLAGGPKKTNVAQFYNDVTHQPHGGVLTYPTDGGEMVNTYQSKNRNQTISIPGQNLLIKYRFIGAAKLGDNCGGLQILLEEKVRQELDLMVQNGGRKPDAIVIHSSAHDMCHTALHHNAKLSSFYGSIDKVGEQMIKPWVEQGINVIWRGAYRFTGEKQDLETPGANDYRIPAKLDAEAKRVMDKNGAKFLDTAGLIANVNDDSGCCSTIAATTATFPHLGAVSMFHSPKAATFLSQLVTYQILDAICPAH